MSKVEEKAGMPMDKVSILILEDNESDLELIKRELRSACPSCSVDWAWSKKSFLKELDQNIPHIVLLDYSLPGFDGLSAMGLLRERFPDVPVIIVSGGIGEETAIGTLRAGATDYVLKQHLHRLGPVIVRTIHEIDDTIQRKRAEEALEASRKRFESLFSASNEGISLHEMVYDENGKAVDYRILDVNPSFEAITGISRPKAVGSLASELYSVSPPPYLSNYLRVVETGQSSHFETYYPPMDKHFLISVFTPDRGQFATMFVDVTERKYLESLLKKKADDLARSNAELQQFAYVASHDLQEPLRMVISYLGLLEKRYQEQLDDRGREYISIAVDGSRRMKALIDDLLEYSRVDTQGAAFAPVDMNEAVAKTLKLLEVGIRENGAEVTVGTLPAIWGDQTQMIQVIQNLVGNAIKYRSAEPPRISITVSTSENEHIFEVRDNGIGFKMEYADRILKMFQRLHTREEYPGTGVGLAICKKIVERHGGLLWARSEEGKGSSFYFSLPKQQIQETG